MKLNLGDSSSRSVPVRGVWVKSNGKAKYVELSVEYFWDTSGAKGKQVNIPAPLVKRATGVTLHSSDEAKRSLDPPRQSSVREHRSTHAQHAAGGMSSRDCVPGRLIREVRYLLCNRSRQRVYSLLVEPDD
jgi:hypothetical protein